MRGKSRHNDMMLRLALFVLTLSLISGCIPLPSVPADKLTPVAETAVYSTVSIHALNNRLVCAGTRISPTLISTAYHCAIAGAMTEKELDAIDVIEDLTGDPNFSFVDPNKVAGREIYYSEFTDMENDDPQNPVYTLKTGIVQAIDAKNDMVVILTKKSRQPYAQIRTAPLRLAEPIFAVGHPKGFPYTVTFGRVAYPKRVLYGTEWIHVDLSILGGNSGGGLYDLDGHLVGVCSMGLGQVHGFYGSVNHLVELY